jgi:hypothetical protein
MPALILFLLWVGAIIYFARQQEEEADHILRNLADREAWLRGHARGLADAPPTAVAPIVRVAPGINIETVVTEEYVPLQYYDKRATEFEHPQPGYMAKEIAAEIVKRGLYKMEVQADYMNRRVAFRMSIMFVTDHEAINNYRG